MYMSKVHGINSNSEMCLDKMLYQPCLRDNHLYMTIKQVLPEEQCTLIDCVVIVLMKME